MKLTTEKEVQQDVETPPPTKYAPYHPMGIFGKELVNSDTSNNAMIAGSKGDVPEVGAMACRGNCGEIAGQC